MPAIAFGVIWAGYSVGLWGWCLLRGYDVTFGQLIDPRTILDWKTATGRQIPSSQVFPGGTSSGSSGSSGSPGANNGLGTGGTNTVNTRS